MMYTGPKDSATVFHSKLASDFLNNYTNKIQFKERQELFTCNVLEFVPQNSRILDLGCGPGVIARDISRKGYSVDGIDGSEEMINIAKELAFSEDRILNFYVKHIPFRSSELDVKYEAIISSSVIEYVREYNETLKLIYDLLNKDGFLLISIPNKFSIYRIFESFVFKLISKPEYLKHVSNRPTKKKFLNDTKKLGFSSVKIKYFGSKKAFKYFSFLPNILTCNLILFVFKK